MSNPVRSVKQPEVYQEQLRILKEKHGLKVRSDSDAIEILERVNYYRFYAYGIGLHELNDKERLVEGTTIEQLYSLYRFDYRFRHLLLSIVEPFEIELRSRVAYHLAITYGPECYTDASLFLNTVEKDGTLVHANIIKKFNDAVIKGKSKPCVIHHQKEYGGKFPVWAAVELFSFGMISSLFSIMSPKDQKVIARQFCLPDAMVLSGWIHAFSDLRNRCAHNDRIYNMPLSQLPALFKEDKVFQVKPKNRVFTIILALKRITSDKDLWDWFFNELCHLFLVHPEVKMNFIGFPQKWEQALTL